MAYIRYFCGNPEDKDALKETETKRMFLYKNTVALIRAYANIADDLEEAGYSQHDIEYIKRRVDFYTKLRVEIKNAGGEILDTKAYEADMRHLIDNYIQAEEPRSISPFGDMSLLDIIVNSGLADALDSLPGSIRSNKDAVAETITNNVRKKIIKDHLIDPAYFEEMSILLDALIRERKANAVSYEEYLNKIVELSKKVSQTTRDDLPAEIKTAEQRALFNNTGKNVSLAVALDEAIKKVKKADWRGNIAKQNEIKAAMYKVLKDTTEVDRLFEIVRQQNGY
jgi:type I restriction enzyme R subunit